MRSRVADCGLRIEEIVSGSSISDHPIGYQESKVVTEAEATQTRNP
jgi:hypothetical protein